MILGTGLLAIVIQLVIAGLIFYVLWWGLQKLSPRLGEPINTILLVILVLAIVVFLVNLLLGLGGHPIRW